MTAIIASPENLSSYLWDTTPAARTARRWTRVDLSLYANLPYGSTTSMPEEKICKAIDLPSATAHLPSDQRRPHRGDSFGGRVVSVSSPALGHGFLDQRTHGFVFFL